MHGLDQILARIERVENVYHLHEKYCLNLKWFLIEKNSDILNC